MILRPDAMSHDERSRVADLIDPDRYIALVPIVTIGPWVLYWTMCDKGHAERVRVISGRVVLTPRVRRVRLAIA